MSRRRGPARTGTRALALPLVLVAGLALGACGEQTPGGKPAGAAAGQQQSQQGQGQPGQAQGETAGDAENPIVVKIGDQEFPTTMAIYRKYDEAKKGPLNLQAPKAPAKEIPGGRMQEYVSGTIYWSQRTGARIVRGQILKTYLDNGGPGGKLGFPVGDETTEGTAVYSDFEHGRIQLKDMVIQVIEKQ